MEADAVLAQGVGVREPVRTLRIGRRVLSPAGRRGAAVRWYGGRGGDQVADGAEARGAENAGVRATGTGRHALVLRLSLLVVAVAVIVGGVVVSGVVGVVVG